MNVGSVYRVQRSDNTAFKITSSTGTDKVTTVIPAFALYITTAGPALASGVTSVAYSVQLASTLGNAPVTWGLASGSGALPTGVTLSSTGLLSGVPSVAATYSFQVEATDFGHYVAPKDFTITVTSGSVPLQFTTTNTDLDQPVVGTVYSDSFAATGGTAPRTFAVHSGSMPTGLSLASSGAITGTPTTVQTVTPTVRVTDNVAATADRTFTFNVIDISPTITTTSLPTGEVEATYTPVVQATGGTPPYTFTCPPLTLPPGLTLSAAGAFTGFPTLGGSYPITVTVTDTIGSTDTQDYTITVFSKLIVDPIDPIVIPVGVDYSFDFLPFVSSGSGGYGFAVVGGDSVLAPELSLSVAGILAGVPTVQGDFPFVLQITDGLGVVFVDVELTTFCG